GCAARSVVAPAHLTCGCLLHPRLRVRLRARSLELVRIRAAHLGVVHRAPGSGVAVRRCAREWEPCARPRGRTGAATHARALRQEAADGGRMGLKIVLLASASVLSFVQGRAQPDGGYAEAGRQSTVALTATAVLA